MYQVIYNGEYPNGDKIKSGVTFTDIRSWYKKDKNWVIVEDAYNSGITVFFGGISSPAIGPVMPMMMQTSLGGSGDNLLGAGAAGNSSSSLNEDKFDWNIVNDLKIFYEVCWDFSSYVLSYPWQDTSQESFYIQQFVKYKNEIVGGDSRIQNIQFFDWYTLLHQATLQNILYYCDLLVSARSIPDAKNMYEESIFLTLHPK